MNNAMKEYLRTLKVYFEKIKALFACIFNVLFVLSLRRYSMRVKKEITRANASKFEHNIIPFEQRKQMHRLESLNQFKSGNKLHGNLLWLNTISSLIITHCVLFTELSLPLLNLNVPP